MVYSGCWNGIGIVGGGMILAIVLVHFVRKLFPQAVLRASHDATGNLLAIVGTLYAVLLGLIVVDAMTRFERAIDCVQGEANCLADIFLLAGRLPDPQRTRIHDQCRNYAEQVVDVEWPLMATGRMSAETRATALHLAHAIDDFEPVTEAQKAVFPLLLEQFRALWDQRRERAGTTQFGIPAVEWTALVIGGLVTVLFAGLFCVENNRLHRLLTALSALVICLNLYLVSLFGYPFAGELSVSSRPFRLELGIFEGLIGETPGPDVLPVDIPADHG